MALNATLEPILIRERRTVITNETITAFKGISHPGRTWRRSVNAFIKRRYGTFGTYMSKEARKWKSLVSSKSEHLARCGCNIGDAATNGQNDEDSCQDRCSGIGLSCNEEGLNERQHICVGEDGVHISQTETECDQHHETHRTVDDNSPHHCTRQCEGGVPDFLRHLQQLVLFAAFR
jgi:hypothetical protein